MKKRNVALLALQKKSISNLSKRVGGAIPMEKSKHGGPTCYVCPTFAADRPGCPSYTCWD